ncbi:unnamed protein product, partial [Ectocarpus sp. 4 AP-2014]
GGTAKTVAVFRVTLSGLKGKRGTFQDVSAGKAWRAALQSIGAEVAPTGQEDSFPSWEGDGEDGLVDTGDPVTDDNDNDNDGGDKDGEEQQQAEKQSPGGAVAAAAAAVAPPAVHAGDGDGGGSNGAEHKVEE